MSPELAINLLHEVGVESVEFSSLSGLRHLDELGRVAEVAASGDLMFEPIAGRAPRILPPILEVCMEAGARRIMHHLYTFVKDSRTGDLDLGLVGNARATIDRAQPNGVK